MKPFSVAGKKVPEWCWTVPALDTKVEKGVYGINWGVCEGYVPPKEGEEESEEEGEEEEGAGDSGGGSSAGAKVKYTIKVTLGPTKGFNGKKGPYFMKINSEEIEG